MTKIRTAVIGAGHFGNYHAGKYAADEAADLVAVVDAEGARAKTVAERHGTRPLTDYRELIGKADAVSVAVTTSAHHEVAGFFLDNGVHVLVEKPIASTIAQADDLIRRAAASGAILQVGHLERFFALKSGLLDLVKKPLYIEAIRIAPFGGRGVDVSVVLDLMIHDIDLIAALVHSPVARIDAVGAPVLTDLEDIVNTRIEFENGCVASITASRVSFKAERKLRIFQPDCLVSVDLMAKTFATIRKSPGTPAADGGTGAARFSMDQQKLAEHDALQAEVSAFLNSVATGSKPVVTGEEGRDALEIGNRIIANLQEHSALVRERILAD